MRIAVLGVVFLMALAGCLDGSGDKDSETTDTTSQDSQGTTTDSQTSTTDNNATGNMTGGSNETFENTPPQGSLTVNVTGEGPFQATFTVDGSDADGDFLEWTLDADGDGQSDADGTSLPATATIELSEGSYNATLNLTDGWTFVEIHLPFNASFERPPRDPFSQGGTLTLNCLQCTEAGANTGVGYRAGMSGLDSIFFEIPAEYVGGEFTATADAGNIDLVFRDSCDGGGAVGDAYVNPGDESGIVPNAACVLMWSPDMNDATLTLTIV